MRCPKCHYISFDSGDRCRNCGYDFSLAVETPENTLGLKPDAETPAPPDDFSLPDLDRSETPAAGRRPADNTWRPADTDASLDLPLFPGGDDRPLVTPPAAPRAPLAVRRATPAVPRLRTPAPEAPERALPLEPAARAASTAPAPAFSGRAERAAPAAPAGARLGAAAVDLVLLAAIDLAVLVLTLRIAGLARDELEMLPLVPLLAFLALLNGGYLVLFTASVGQTLGKMAFGLRVVDADDAAGGPPAVGQAALRALALVLSIAPIGLGYLPALFGDDRRAFHDRLADTRVVSDRS